MAEEKAVKVEIVYVSPAEVAPNGIEIETNKPGTKGTDEPVLRAIVRMEEPQTLEEKVETWGGEVCNKLIHAEYVKRVQANVRTLLTHMRGKNFDDFKHKFREIEDWNPTKEVSFREFSVGDVTKAVGAMTSESREAFIRQAMEVEAAKRGISVQQLMKSLAKS